MLTGRRYLLALTEAQAAYAEQIGGACRAVWNVALEQRREYRRRGAWIGPDSPLNGRLWTWRIRSSSNAGSMPDFARTAARNDHPAAPLFSAVRAPTDTKTNRQNGRNDYSRSGVNLVPSSATVAVLNSRIHPINDAPDAWPTTAKPTHAHGRVVTNARSRRDFVSSVQDKRCTHHVTVGSISWTTPCGSTVSPRRATKHSGPYSKRRSSAVTTQVSHWFRGLTPASTTAPPLVGVATEPTSTTACGAIDKLTRSRTISLWLSSWAGVAPLSIDSVNRTLAVTGRGDLAVGRSAKRQPPEELEELVAVAIQSGTTRLKPCRGTSTTSCRTNNNQALVLSEFDVAGGRS